MKTLKVAWNSPSNIALIKYWGKLEGQIPANPSVSFTLKKSLTTTTLTARPKEQVGDGKKELSLEFLFEGRPKLKFEQKIEAFLEKKIAVFPWLLDFHLKLESENTFPHSSGIASSASSMSALSLCLLSMDEKIKGASEKDFLKKASDLSRQASGSAARSVYPFLASWGEIEGHPETSNLFASAIPKEEVHEIFWDYADSILIVDEGEKSFSSRAGHDLMNRHPFASQRFHTARTNMAKILSAMKRGALEDFIQVVEEEALMLHALMMTSSPNYLLLKPLSLHLIEKIREWRAREGIPVCFTIDAGPNIHLLYPKKDTSRVHQWLTSECPRVKVIHDEVGLGPSRLEF